MNLERLKDRIISHEGLRLKPYRDQLGFITIGIGRCLDKKGISKEEAFYLFFNDINDAVSEVSKRIGFYNNLDDSRQEVLIEMCFQMGIVGLLMFRRFLLFLEAGHYTQAADEMLDSLWAKQTPVRAKELSDIIKGVI